MIALIEGLRDHSAGEVRQTVVIRRASRLSLACSELQGIDLRPVPNALVGAVQAAWDGDIVHVHDEGSLVAGALASMSGLEIVVNRRSTFEPASTLWSRWAARSASAIVCRSRHAAALAVRRSNARVPLVIPGCSRFPPLASARNRADEIVSSPLVVACVGEIDFGEKGQDLIIQVAQEIEDEGLDVEFLFAGVGRDYYRLVTGAQQLGCVQVLGWLDDVSHVLKNADVMVHTSRSEGSSSVVLESMAQGTPVVAASVGGIAELVEDGVNGLLVARDSVAELKRAIVHLAEERSVVQRLSDNALATARQFTARRMSSTYEALYRVLTAGDDSVRAGRYFVGGSGFRASPAGRNHSVADSPASNACELRTERQKFAGSGSVADRVERDPRPRRGSVDSRQGA